MKKGIISVLSALAGAAVGAAAVGKTASEKGEKLQMMSDKHLALFLMMNQWVKVKQEGSIWHRILKRTDIERLPFME